VCDNVFTWYEYVREDEVARTDAGAPEYEVTRPHASAREPRGMKVLKIFPLAGWLHDPPAPLWTLNIF
jgi:hypothetical protein